MLLHNEQLLNQGFFCNLKVILKQDILFYFQKMLPSLIVADLFQAQSPPLF